MIIEIGYVYYDIEYSEFWETPENISDSDIEKIIFDAIKYAYENTPHINGDYNVNLKWVVCNSVFNEYLESKGFKRICRDKCFEFDGLINISNYKEEVYADMDKKLWEFLDKEIRGGD